jgi:hypothetical protein
MSDVPVDNHVDDKKTVEDDVSESKRKGDGVIDEDSVTPPDKKVRNGEMQGSEVNCQYNYTKVREMEYRQWNIAWEMEYFFLERLIVPIFGNMLLLKPIIGIQLLHKAISVECWRFAGRDED